MNTMTKTNGRHTNGASPGNGNGRAVLTETIPIVQVLSPDGPDASALNGVSEIPDRDPAPEAEAMPAGNSEGESQGESERESVSGAPLSLPDRLARHREQLPPRRYDWPAEAERPSERLKYKQARAVDLLVFGMTETDVAAQLGVNRGTVHRWRKDPIFVAQLEARRSELADSLLDLHMLGNRIGLGKLLELVESTNDSLALRAATTLVNSGQRAYQSIDEKKRIERLEDNMGMVHGLKV
jgi:hypothetical protein